MHALHAFDALGVRLYLQKLEASGKSAERGPCSAAARCVEVAITSVPADTHDRRETGNMQRIGVTTVAVACDRRIVSEGAERNTF